MQKQYKEFITEITNLSEEGSVQKSASKLKSTLDKSWAKAIKNMSPKSRPGYQDTKAGKQMSDAIDRADKIAGSKDVSDADKSWLFGYIKMISNPGK